MKEVNVFQTDKISFKDGILHGHNQDAYQKMRDALKYGNRAFIEHATGTGKFGNKTFKRCCKQK